MIVAAGSAYDLYSKYAMYFCQPGRSFQPIQRIGFYTGNEIKPDFCVSSRATTTLALTAPRLTRSGYHHQNTRRPSVAS